MEGHNPRAAVDGSPRHEAAAQAEVPETNSCVGAGHIARRSRSRRGNICCHSFQCPGTVSRETAARVIDFDDLKLLLEGDFGVEVVPGTHAY